MHVPDGFISPKMYLPAYGVAAGFWAYGLHHLRRDLSGEMIPRLAVMTALAFALMMIAIPLPGGTTVHASGIAMIACVFGVWTSFLAISVVLLLQAVAFGQGGITSLPLNALAMGLVGSACAAGVFAGGRRLSEKAALFTAGWLSLTLPAALMALALGVQPLIAHGPDGTPRFFPFGVSVTIPALVLPHMLVGVGEGVLTVLAYRFFSAARGRGPR